MERESSPFVLANPDHVSRILESVLRWTEGDLLVWRRVEANPKRLMAYPSDKIQTPADFAARIGNRFAGVTVGYPAEAEEKNDELWLRITDGAGNQYYVEHRDAPKELRRLMRAVHRLAAAKCNQGKITPMPLFG